METPKPMPTQLLFLSLLCLFLSCGSPPEEVPEATAKYQDIDLSTIDTSDFLLASSATGGAYAFGKPFVFMDQSGQVVIPAKAYDVTFTDTLRTFATVVDSAGQMIGVDRSGQRLFEVFAYDNGPDYVEEGLFRVLRDGKIGYAIRLGEVVIPCQFECAYPFKGGRAKVADTCTTVQEGGHSQWESEAWYYIDQTGKRLP
ncbi:MAG: hypothetical protein GVY26_20760 [Bacteroidetes bacterium]|nr:hypothetical protein [Bacteroidota bacterium]